MVIVRRVCVIHPGDQGEVGEDDGVGLGKSIKDPEGTERMV